MPEMKTLSFDTGLVTFTLNGTCEVSFNPTDSFFVEKLFNTFDALDRKEESYRDQVAKMADKREIFDFARKRDQEMRALIDDLFGVPVCGALFGGMNVYSLADGLPVWTNLFMAVIDEVDTTFAREQKATNPRIQKYTAKYSKK